MTDNESNIKSNIFEKIFRVIDVSTIDNSWRAVIIFSNKKSFENENEKFILDELIYKAMTKLNMTSDLFVIGGFRKANI